MQCVWVRNPLNQRLQLNGSVCGGCLSLIDAAALRPMGGIAMGWNQEDNRFAVLTESLATRII